MLTPNIALKSGSLNLNGMFDTWRRFGWDLESIGVEDVVVVPLEGEIDKMTAVSVSLVCTPDVAVVVVDTNDDLASTLALTFSASELSENSWKVARLKKMGKLNVTAFNYFELIIAVVGCCGYWKR